MNRGNSKLVRIGVFYDGNYFLHVSNYYNFSHPRRSRISISGLHEFIRHEVAHLEGVSPNLSQVVDAHYFRGRLPAQEAKNRNKLLSERLFEDILMKEGVITHFLPLTKVGEKGIDTWLALEAFELSLLKHFDVVVLIACDSDFVPLVRKLNAMGTRVMVLGWDFEYTDEYGNKRVTVTSAALQHEVSYAVRMAQRIDDRGNRNSSLIDGLFVPRDFEFEPRNAFNDRGTPTERTPVAGTERPPHPAAGERHQGRVQNVKEGYGFIDSGGTGRNLFFYWEDVDGDFNDLKMGDLVEYSLGYNHRGECAVDVVKLTDASELDPMVAQTTMAPGYDD
jgi:uncharacterized LabA/DUF88 family protein/cold shock CspA family protein